MTRMNYSLEEKAVQMLRHLAQSFTEDPDEPINGGDAVDIILELLAEVRPLLAKIDEDAQEQASLEEYRIAALEKQVENEIQVDPNSEVSVSADDGAWVAAWIWVYDSEAGVEREEEGDEEETKTVFDLAHDTALHPAIAAVVDVCIAGAPAINGVCGDPDCVCGRVAGD